MIHRFAIHPAPILVLLALGLVLLLPPGPAVAQPGDAADPDRPWAADADALLAEGRFAQAEKAYERLSAEHADDSGLWTRIAWARLQLGEISGAMEAAVEATRLAPEDLDAILMRAQCEAVAGDTGAAAATLQRGLELAPDNAALMESMTATFIALEKWPEAAGLLRELIRRHPEEPGYYMDLGRILLTGGEYADAVAAFGQAATLGGDEAMALAMTGKAHLAAGEWDPAMAEFEQSIALRPNADAYGGRATVHYLRGDPAAAVEDFRRAIELAPRDPDLQFNLGNMLVQTGDAAGAERAYRRSLEMDPQSAEANLNLGILLLNRFEVEEARQHLLLATRADDTLAAPWLHLARIASARFEFAEAGRAYERYRARIDDPEEIRRIDDVIARLEQKVEASRAAVDRGEVHLLQARFADEDAARDLIARVRGGGDFFLLAGELSDIGQRGGVDVGFMDPTTAQPALQGAISGLAVGEMTDPVELAGNWFVFMRVE